jgi:hypothetical protein
LGAKIVAAAIGANDGLGFGGGFHLDALQEKLPLAVPAGVGMRRGFSPVMANDILVTRLGWTQGNILSTNGAALDSGSRLALGSQGVFLFNMEYRRLNPGRKAIF